VEDGYEEREGMHPMAEMLLRQHQAKQGREDYERMQVGREGGIEGGKEVGEGWEEKEKMDAP
jgi:hypothetical protein